MSKTGIISKLNGFAVGAKASITRKITALELEKFIQLSGDDNPLHTKKGIVHGAFLNSILSGLIGTKLPGHGTIIVNQYITYPNSCYVGDEVKIEVELETVRKIAQMRFVGAVGERIVIEGTAKVIFRDKNLH